MKKLALLLCTSMLASYSYATEPTKEVEKEEVLYEKKDAGEEITDVVKSPFKDFNLTKDKIPAILEKAKSGPYAIPENKTCETMEEEIKELTYVLGPDLDTPVEEGNKVKNAAGKAALGALNKTVQGAIPYRGWIRNLSGAEKHSKKIEASGRAGFMRRAFLKGYVLGMNCHPLARLIDTPVVENEKPSDIVAEQKVDANSK